MGGDRHALGLANQRLVDLADVALMKVLGIVAATGDLNPLLRVIEIGQARVVELEGGTAELAQTADLLGIRGAEVAPEVLDGGGGSCRRSGALPTGTRASRPGCGTGP